MSEEVSMSKTIQDVGSSLYEELDNNLFSTKDVHSLMKRHGLFDTEHPKRITCDLASFNRLLKLTLYEIYRLEGYNLKALEPSVDQYALLVKAYAETGDLAFKENSLDGLVEGVDETVFARLLDVYKDLIETDGAPDRIGLIYESILPKSARRKLGQYRTPVVISELMARWAIQDPDDTVLDPGIGAGVLTANTYEVKNGLGGNSSVDDIWGVDVSELAIIMSSTALKISNGEGSPNIIHANFMDTVPEGANNRIESPEPHELPKVDAIVANPPYSRSASFQKDNERFNRLIEAEVGLSITKRAPLYPYFLAHSLQFLREEGRMSIIIPKQFLETNYGEELRKFILSNFSVRGLVIMDEDITIFESADADPCILFLGNRDGDSTTISTFIKLNKIPDSDDILDAITNDVHGETQFGFVNQVRQCNLIAEFNWSDYVNPETIDAIPGLKPFDEIAEIKRGIATGSNDYFCLTESEVNEWELDKKYLVRIIRRTSGISTYNLIETDWNQWRDEGDTVWLLYCYDEDEETFRESSSEALRNYLEYGKEVGAASSYLAKHRNPWYLVDKRNPPDIFATYMSKNGFRFLDNQASLRSLNNLHNIYLPNFSKEERQALLAFLNSTIANEIAKRSGRKYARGLHKIEPNELKETPVLDPRKLNSSDVFRLAEAFEQFCLITREDKKLTQFAQEILDGIVDDVLGPEKSTLDLPKKPVPSPGTVSK